MKSPLFLLLLAALSCEERSGDESPTPAPVPTGREIEVEVVEDIDPDPDPFGVVIGAHVTRYEPGGPRGENIELASRRLDGRTIGPGEGLSFNDVVGVRSEDAGFKKAPVIFMGTMEEDVGGGVCQVSSTLHAAALRSNIEIVRRAPHSRPAAYIKMGLDATVSYPPACGDDHRANDRNGKNPACYSLDLVLRNPHPWPVRLKAKSGGAEDGGDAELSFTFFGREWLERKVTFRSTFQWTREPERKYRPVPWKKDPGYERRVQKGKRGRFAMLTVMTEFRDGGIRTDRYPSDYPPVDEVWEVWSGWGPDAGTARDAGPRD